MSKPLRVLHTSDWHLGRTLHEHPRDDEFDAFLQWILHTVEEQKIDVLLIAGDIFDTSNPPYSAQQRYYDFCTKLNRTCCHHAVITSGNHDSATFIDVPGLLLEHLNIHVIGQPRFGVGKSGTPEDEIVTIQDDKGEDLLIVAAVPFLSDGDVRYSAEGEDTATKEEKMRLGVAKHYNDVAKACECIRDGRDIPVIAMGHLYVTGGIIVEDDGVRMTYVGSLGGIDSSLFSPSFDYVALGHLHVPQTVGLDEHIRYSGSPLPMGFGEAGQQKSVCILNFEGKKLNISLYEIPCFHKMERIEGDKEDIQTRLRELLKEEDEIYVSVTYTGNEYIDNVMNLIQDILLKSNHKILCLHTQNKGYRSNLSSENPTRVKNESLDDYHELDVFNMLLDTDRPGISSEERQQLIDTFQELLIQAQSK